MVIDIKLQELPTRRAIITVSEDGQSLSCELEAPTMQDSTWDEIKNHEDKLLDYPGGEAILKQEAEDFRDSITTTISTLRNALTLISNNISFKGESEPFLHFAERLISEEKAAGHSPSKVEKYRVATSRFKQFLQSTAKEGILMRNLNSEVIEHFNHALSAEGLKLSTIAFYNRILNVIYNRGVKQGLSVDNSPFATVATQYRQ